MNRVLILVITFTALLSYADEMGEVQLLETESKDRKISYHFVVAKDVIAESPDWSPENVSIPLQPQEAARLALKRYKELYPSATTAKVVGFTLTPIGSHTRPTKWAYWVRFRVADSEKDRVPGQAVSILVVLLDGRVVDPAMNPNPMIRTIP